MKLQELTSSQVANNQYHALFNDFQWDVPERFNIADVCCRRWSHEQKQIAIFYEDSTGNCRKLTYRHLYQQANQLSNLLRQQGVQRGDVVACIMPQRPEMAVTMMACLQMGAIVMPLSHLFGPEALEYRLRHSDATTLILDQTGVDAYMQIAQHCSQLKTIIGVDCQQVPKNFAALEWETYVGEMPKKFESEKTRATDPAILIYTSGTTGDPKGALIPHSAILGNLPGFVASQNWFPQAKDVFWSPADWAWTGGLMDALRVTPNEMFGQTEMNYIVGNSYQRWPAKPGSMGRPYPGHRVAVINDAGVEVAPGKVGEVAVNRNDIHGHPDPVFFLGYWKNDAATRNKYSGEWCRTGDLAIVDTDGYLWYQGRADDMFKAAGYRIGPSEIENCLIQHPAVANAAVVPKPDKERGNLVKAYIVLRTGIESDDQLIKELQAYVKGKLAPYEYPKEIEFIDALPMTTTGKIQRRVLKLREIERAETTSSELKRRTKEI